MCDDTADTVADIRAIPLIHQAVFCYHNISIEFADTSTLCRPNMNECQCHHNRNVLIDRLHVNSLVMSDPQNGRLPVFSPFRTKISPFSFVLCNCPSKIHSEVCKPHISDLSHISCCELSHFSLIVLRKSILKCASLTFLIYGSAQFFTIFHIIMKMN